jgi:hypothetical protein
MSQTTGVRDIQWTVRQIRSSCDRFRMPFCCIRRPRCRERALALVYRPATSACPLEEGRSLTFIQSACVTFAIACVASSQKMCNVGGTWNVPWSMTLAIGLKMRIEIVAIVSITDVALCLMFMLRAGIGAAWKEASAKHRWLNSHEPHPQRLVSPPSLSSYVQLSSERARNNIVR